MLPTFRLPVRLKRIQNQGSSQSRLWLASFGSCRACKSNMRAVANAHSTCVTSRRVGLRRVCASAHSRRDALLSATVLAAPAFSAAPAAAATSLFDFTVQQYGQDVELSRYRGKSLVIVNVASE